MEIYIDESGSVHPTNKRLNRYFIIGIILPNDKKKLLRTYKLFVRKNYNELSKIDKENKMFDENGKFKELKGSCFNKDMKLKFMDFFFQKQEFKVGYIILDNSKLQERFISNKTRKFIYLLKLFLTYAIQKKYISNQKLFLNIEEKNVKTESKYSLEDYLYQELCLNLNIIQNANAKYYDSAQNKLIQVADVFSNIMYSNLVTDGNYSFYINQYIKKGYILPLFIFPK